MKTHQVVTGAVLTAAFGLAAGFLLLTREIGLSAVRLRRGMRDPVMTIAASCVGAASGTGAAASVEGRTSAAGVPTCCAVALAASRSAAAANSNDPPTLPRLI